VAECPHKTYWNPSIFLGGRPASYGPGPPGHFICGRNPARRPDCPGEALCLEYQTARAEAAEALLLEIAGHINAHASDATYEAMRWAQVKIEALLPEKRSSDD